MVASLVVGGHETGGMILASVGRGDARRETPQKGRKMNVYYPMADVQFPRKNGLVSELVLFHFTLGHSLLDKGYSENRF
jgi:hypothetical protein